MAGRLTTGFHLAKENQTLAIETRDPQCKHIESVIGGAATRSLEPLKAFLFGYRA